MAYKTIVLFLFLIFIQIAVFGQPEYYSDPSTVERTDTLITTVEGIDTLGIGTLGTMEVGIDTLSAMERLQCTVDSIMGKAINEKAFPGGVVYAAFRGIPFFEKSYGFHTYDSLDEVKLTDIYDLASVSKPTGATLAMMKLYELNLIRLDDPLKEYINGLGWNKKGKSTIREALTHQAGFQGWIKYYEKIRKRNGKYRHHTISNTYSEDFPYQITNGMYVHKDFYHKIKRYIKHSTFHPQKEFIYSDLFFSMVPEIVENLTGVKYEDFLHYYFYDTLGATTVGFNPELNFDLDRIIPTEIDTFFRMEPIHGKVHDEAAILMGGVSGHAGLFADADDLAKVWQMILNAGTYEDREYLDPTTIQLFTSYQFPQTGNRKALGFDKPMIDYDEVVSSVAKSASIYSFGHTGFTGPLVWADPDNQLLFIFLTNRVYPSRENKAIYRLNVRPTLHEVFYQFLQRAKL